jgi:hypothetical protein
LPSNKLVINDKILVKTDPELPRRMKWMIIAA